MTVKVVQGLGIRALTTYKELLDSLRSLAVRLFGASCWRTIDLCHFLPDIPPNPMLLFFVPYFSSIRGFILFLEGGFLEC